MTQCTRTAKHHQGINHHRRVKQASRPSHVPRYTRSISNQTNRHYLCDYSFLQGPSCKTYLPIKTPGRSTGRPKLLPRSAPRVVVSTHPTSRATPCPRAHHPPTASPRRSREPDPPGGDSPRLLVDAGAGDAPVRRGARAPARRRRAGGRVLPPRRRPERFREG